MRATIRTSRLRTMANGCPKWFTENEALSSTMVKFGYILPVGQDITLWEVANLIEKQYGRTYEPSQLNFSLDFLRFLEKLQEVKNNDLGRDFMWAFLENWRYPFFDEPKSPFFDSAIYLVFGDGGKVNRAFHLLDKDDAREWAREMSREHRGESVSLSYISAIWNVKKSRPVYREAVLGWYRNGKQEY